MYMIQFWKTTLVEHNDCLTSNILYSAIFYRKQTTFGIYMYIVGGALTGFPAYHISLASYYLPAILNKKPMKCDKH